MARKEQRLLMTECNQISFRFAPHFSRRVQADFAGGQISSDGGALLLRETERRVEVIGRFTTCFRDQRHPSFITHEVGEMIRQRIYSLALGYEDLNDQESLRHDPLLGLLAGKRKVGEEPLAGKST